MAPAIGRLKKRPEFLKVAASRCKWVAPGLILQVLRREPAGQSSDNAAQSGTGLRIGFTVSRKVGNAVKRNRARRRLRAAADEVMPELGRPGHDYVVIGRGSTLTRDFEDLKSDLRAAIERATTKKGSGSKRRSRDRKESTRGPRTDPASRGS